MAWADCQLIVQRQKPSVQNQISIWISFSAVKVKLRSCSTGCLMPPPPLSTFSLMGQVVVMGPDDLMVSVARWWCFSRRSDVDHTYRICPVWAAGHCDILLLFVTLTMQFLGRAICRIVTESGIILNCLISDLFWPNQRTGQPQSNQVVHPPRASPVIISSHL